MDNCITLDRDAPGSSANGNISLCVFSDEEVKEFIQSCMQPVKNVSYLLLYACTSYRETSVRAIKNISSQLSFLSPCLFPSPHPHSPTLPFYISPHSQSPSLFLCESPFLTVNLPLSLSYSSVPLCSSIFLNPLSPFLSFLFFHFSSHSFRLHHHSELLTIYSLFGRNLNQKASYQEL